MEEKIIDDNFIEKKFIKAAIEKIIMRGAEGQIDIHFVKRELFKELRIECEDRMKYEIKMTISGDFPGSPDHDYFIVDEVTWIKVRDIIFPKYLNPEFDLYNLRKMG